MEEFVVQQKYIPYLVGTLKAETMLVTSLNCIAMANRVGTEDTTGEDNGWIFHNQVYKIKPSSFLRHFNLSVGGERQSSGDVIHRILSFQHNDINVTCDHTNRMNYLNLSEIEREHMGSCLLQALFFYNFVEENYTTPELNKDKVSENQAIVESDSEESFESTLIR